MVAARSLTVPIGRLRRVSARVAQGQLDERAAPSGVLEIDELGQQFNVMADRLSGTLRMLEADRDRLREFVADVSHELRTPIAALRLYTELLSDDNADETIKHEFLERSTEQIQTAAASAGLSLRESVTRFGNNPAGVNTAECASCATRGSCRTWPSWRRVASTQR